MPDTSEWRLGVILTGLGFLFHILLAVRICLLVHRNIVDLWRQLPSFVFKSLTHSTVSWQRSVELSWAAVHMSLPATLLAQRMVDSLCCSFVRRRCVGLSDLFYHWGRHAPFVALILTLFPVCLSSTLWGGGDSWSQFLDCVM